MKNTRAFILGLAVMFLIPFGSFNATAQSNVGKVVVNKGADKNIVELAVATKDLSTLVAAVQAGGLVETLQGNGPFTVFAPTNEAFAALPEGLLEKLLKPENKATLVKILTYHVVSGDIASSSLKNNQKAATVEGNKVKVTINKQGVMVNDAKVAIADVKASNGIVHVIDKVILPPGLKL